MAVFANALKQVKNVWNIFSEYLAAAGVTDLDRKFGDAVCPVISGRSKGG